MSTREMFEAQTSTARQKGFDKWLAQPMTSAIVSMIPENENKDIVRAVLRAAYDTGFEQGCGETALSFLQSFMREPKR